MGSNFGSEVRIASHADCWLRVRPTPLHVVITCNHISVRYLRPDYVSEAQHIFTPYLGRFYLRPWVGRPKLKTRTIKAWHCAMGWTKGLAFKRRALPGTQTNWSEPLWTTGTERRGSCSTGILPGHKLKWQRFWLSLVQP